MLEPKRYGQFTRLFYHSAKSNLGMRHVGSIYLTEVTNCVHYYMYNVCSGEFRSSEEEGSPEMEDLGTRADENSWFPQHQIPHYAKSPTGYSQERMSSPLLHVHS